MAADKLQPAQPPNATLLEGAYVRLEKVEKNEHADGFEESLCGATNAALWDYIPFGPITDSEHLFAVLKHTEKTLGWLSFAIRELSSGDVLGTVSLMRLRPEHASAEVGCVVFGSRLQKTPGATEVIYLLARYLFDDLKYRRFEWKCDSQNDASKRAAKRFGFSYEGTFRNDMIVKGRNRDTCWYAMTDADWCNIKPAYDRWLSHHNFDDDGVQLTSLKTLIEDPVE